MAGVDKMLDDAYLMQAHLDTVTSKIKDMEEQIKRQEQAVSKLAMLLKEVDRFQAMESDFERASGLQILSVSDEILDIRIKSYVPNVQAISSTHSATYEHELTIKLNMTTMAIDVVQLTPEDVPYEDLLAEVKTTSPLHEASLVVNGGELWSKQISTFVTRIRQRIHDHKTLLPRHVA